MKILLNGVALAALLVVPAAIAAQPPLSPAVIAVVDRQRIAAQCNACVTARAQLQAQAIAYQSRVQQLGAPLETEAQSLRAAVQAAGGTPPPALRTRITAFETQQAAAQRELAASEQTLQRNVAFVRQQIEGAIDAAVPPIMTARRANIAIDRAVTIAMNAPQVEITDAVLATVNQRLPSINTVAPLAPATPAPTATPVPPAPRPQGR